MANGFRRLYICDYKAITVEVTDLGEAKGDTGKVGKGGKGRW